MLIFGLTYIKKKKKFEVAKATSKMTDAILELEKMNRQLVKVSAPQSKSSFQTFQNTILYARGLSGTTIFVSLKTEGRSYRYACFEEEIN